MSSPFSIFRKYQAVMLAVFGVIIIILFTIGDSLNKESHTPHFTDPVVATWSRGKITQSQLRHMEEMRRTTAAFLRNVRAKTGDMRGWQPLLNENNLTPEAALNTMLLAAKAEQMGLTVTIKEIQNYLKNEIGLQRVSLQDMNEMIQGTPDSPTHRSANAIIYGPLRDELLANRMLGFTFGGLPEMPPAEQFANFARVQEKVTAQVIAVPVDQFLPQVAEPSDAEVSGYFEQFKDRLPQVDVVSGAALTSPEPGFKLPRRVSVEYLKADFKEMVDHARSSVTEKEITKYYDENKDRDPMLQQLADQPLPPGGGLKGGPLAPPNKTPGGKSPTPPAGTDKPGAGAAGKKPDDAKKQDDKKPEDKKPVDGAKKTEPAADKSAPAKNGEDKAKESAEPGKPDPDKKTEPEKKQNASPAKEAEPGKVTPTPTPTTEGNPLSPVSDESSRQVALADDSKKPAEGDKPPTDAKEPPKTPDAGKAPETDKAPAKDATDKAPAPAAPADKAAAEKTPAEKSPEKSSPDKKSPDKATPGFPPTDAAPVKPKYRPLAEVKDYIQGRVAEGKVGDKMMEDFGVLEKKLATYKELKDQADVDPALKHPEAENFDELAKKYGFTAHKTPLISRRQLQQDTDIGGSYTTEQGLPYFAAAFGDKGAASLWRPIKSMDLAHNMYLSWKVEDADEAVPQLKGDVRQEVVKQWKRGAGLEADRKARALALADAETLAERIRKGESPADVAKSRPGLEVKETYPFSWLTRPEVNYMSREEPPPPALSKVEDIIEPGPAFMEAVFKLPAGGVGVAMNHPKNYVYVVKVMTREPSTNVLYEEFMAAMNMNSWHAESFSIARSQASGMMVRLMKDLETEFNFTRVSKDALSEEN